MGYNYVDRWHERRELFAEEDRHDHPDWKMVGTESAPAEDAYDNRYSLGDDSTVVAAQLHVGDAAGRAVAEVDRHARLLRGRLHVDRHRLPGRGAVAEQGFPTPARWTSPAARRIRSICTRACGPTRPVLHLFPHWNWPGREGQVIPVLAYTNCTSVTLYLNGRSLGEKRLRVPGARHLGRVEHVRADRYVAHDHQRRAPRVGRAVRTRGAACGG